MSTGNKAVLLSALLLAFAGSAVAQGAGGGSAGGNGGQGGTGMSTPSANGSTGTTSSSKGADTMKSPTRMPQKNPHAKGASDTAASGAQ